MSDWLKVFGEMSLDNLFVIAGLAFLGIGIIGKSKIDPSPRARVIAAIVGICLMGSGIWIHRGHPSVSPSKVEVSSSTPGNEVHAQEVIPDGQVAAFHS